MTSEDIFGDHAPGRINEIGDFATCGCGLPIQYNGDGWEHLNGKGYPHLPRPEKPLTDSARIAAAVAELKGLKNDAVWAVEHEYSDIQSSIVEVALGKAVLNVLTILEGRAEA